MKKSEKVKNIGLNIMLGIGLTLLLPAPLIWHTLKGIFKCITYICLNIANEIHTVIDSFRGDL